MMARQYIVHNLGYALFVGSLLAASAFFTYKVEVFRAEVANRKAAEAVPSGVTVRLEKVVDGDEIVVRTASGSRFVVRLLGVKVFSARVNEPGVSSFGKSCVAHIESEYRGKEVVLRFEAFKRDAQKRVLSYVHVGGVDLGKRLVEKGLAMTFLRFPFSREKEYLSVQGDAMEAGRGLWSSPRAAERARALKASWEAMRDDV